MKKECNTCKVILKDEDIYCSNCGEKYKPEWKNIEKEEFLTQILGKNYIKSAYWNDDYAGFTTIFGDDLYCGYENSFKLEINGKQIIGISNSLKWYEQFATKEMIEYHLNDFDFNKKLFAGLSLLIQLKYNAS